MWTAAGPVAIEMLDVGDRVIAHDEKSGELTLRAVTRVYVRRLSPIVAVTMLAAGGQVETFPTTEEHPFLVEAEKTGGEPVWRRADHLKPGDLVRTLDRGTARVESITYTDRATKVYNLEVEGLHNYHVGENGVVVHNGMCNAWEWGKNVAEHIMQSKHNWNEVISGTPTWGQVRQLLERAAAEGTESAPIAIYNGNGVKIGVELHKSIIVNGREVVANLSAMDNVGKWVLKNGWVR